MDHNPLSRPITPNNSEYRLLRATSQQMLDVKTWFSNTKQIITWGGPNMVYPMPDKDYLALLQASHLHSFALLEHTGQMLAFGQFYVRLGRHHLGRLAVNPKWRGQGLSRVLISGLLTQAPQLQHAQGASLFVFADNHVALQCYRSLGFILRDYPEPMPANMPDCLYMIRD